MKIKTGVQKISKSCKASVIILLVSLVCFSRSYAQLFVFAQLQGAPLNTSGWNMTGTAHVGNIKSNDNSELILCTTGTSQTGSIFYNQPIDISKCDQWKAEFDFRIYDGTAADGIAFCFLNVPPSGFISGEGVGIPGTSDGLKVVFDTYNNCVSDHNYAVPKIELRWGTGYNECTGLPTKDNSGGELSFIRSDSYNHAVIAYNAGSIKVEVNGQTYLTGTQKLSLRGYLGFTSGTGGNFDNHSIKNVTLYTNVPSFDAGNDVDVCSGQSVQIGSASNDLYQYQWTPSEGLSSATDAQPLVNIANSTDEDISRTYHILTTLTDGSGCTAEDSVTVRVKTLSPPSVSIQSPFVQICDHDELPQFKATITAGGLSPQYEWMINGEVNGTNSDTFLPDHLLDGDVITCRLTNEESCASENSAISNMIRMTVFPSPGVDAGDPVTIDYGSAAQLHSTVTGDVQSIAWTPVAGLSNARISLPVASPRKTTLYTVTVQTSEGCKASDTVRVKVISKDVMVPSAFTPNGDGENDIFKPVVLGSTLDYSFTVFNRWGQKVYQSRVQDVGWDGYVGGEKQTAGVYTWRLSCTLDTNVHVEKKGTVVLVR